MINPELAPQTVAFQGNLGAHTHEASMNAFPHAKFIPCATFDDALETLESGKADLGLIPVENSTMGRIADIHHLMPHTPLHIVGEYFHPVKNSLLGLKGAKKQDIQAAYSQIPALMQCRKNLHNAGIAMESFADTAGAAKFVADSGNKAYGAIASKLAAEVYGLDILEENMNDTDHNTTRFMFMTKDNLSVPYDAARTYKTTFLFQVRSIPAALYKALGGFATNGVNLTKLESYIVDGGFTVAQFYADIEGHIDATNVQQAFEELRFYSDMVKVLGSYPANPPQI